MPILKKVFVYKKNDNWYRNINIWPNIVIIGLRFQFNGFMVFLGDKSSAKTGKRVMKQRGK